MTVQLKGYKHGTPLITWLFSGEAARANGGAPAAGSAGSRALSGSGSSPTFAPGQGAIFTQDPTVNGPWTHTRADIPLFKAAPGPAPNPPTGTPVPTRAPGGGSTRPVPGGGKPPPVPRPPRPFSGPFDNVLHNWPSPSWGGENPPKHNLRNRIADALQR